MNPHYSGPNVPPPPQPGNVGYGQASQPQSFNGYESHSPGYIMSPPPPASIGAPPTKGFAQSQQPYTMSNMNVQNGPSAAQQASMPPYSSGTNMPAYNQAVSPQLQPTSGVATDQLAQRFGNLNMAQSSSAAYPPPPVSLSTPKRLPGPFPDVRPSQLDSSRQPYPASFQSSVSGQYRLSHPPMPQQIQGYSGEQQQQQPPPPPPSSQGAPPRMSMMGEPHATRFPMSGGSVQSPARPPQSNTPSALYGGLSSGPPTSVGMSDSTMQNGSYYPGPMDANSPVTVQPMHMAYNSQANGPSVSAAPPQYSQMPMQGRYPPMPQQQQQQGPPGQGMPPPQSQQQYPPQNAGLPQNRMPTSMPSAAPAQSRRLDPDHMPSPIQVIEDDRKSHSGIFTTNAKGLVPPLVTTDFVCTDGGICNPRFMRSTIYTVPTSAEILKQTCVPFGISFSPFARLHEGENPPPISEPIDSGPVRCIRCKAYMCPYMQFIDGGRRFQCIFCKATTEVPPEYFAHLDHMGERLDKYQRPELCLGSYEFVATKEYCKNSVFPNSPAFIFAIDVSYNSVRNGMVKLLCENMKSVLAHMPREPEDQPPKIRIGFITYSNVVHFYNIKSVLAQPQMLVVSDVQDMFMPLLDGFLVDYVDAEPVIDSLLGQIPEMFTDSRETETVLGPAIQAGLEALKAADCAGKLFVFHTTLPIGEAPGKLRNRDDRKLLGTEKEKTILTPQTTFYNNLGQECVAAGCCVDLFLFPNAYIDVATLGQVCRLTGGQLYKYTYFQADIDGRRFLEDLKKDVSKPIAFDSIIRVRTSTGIRPTEFWGNFFMSNTTDIEVAAIDCDKAIAVEIKYDDKLGEDDGAYIQAAVLYTSCGGQRRLRIHNLALTTSSQMADLFRNCELDTIMNLFSKEAIRMITEHNPRHVKDHFVSRSAQILACYRKNCANRSSAGQLILPECMKLLPLYINCLIKCDAIAGGQDLSTDDRSFVMLALNSMDVESSAAYLYPRLLPLHNMSPDSDELPVAIRCSIEKIKEYGVYVIENGLVMFVWIGMGVNPDWLQEVFGVQTPARVDIEKTQILELDTPLSKRVQSVINKVQSERQRHMKLVIVRQGDKAEVLFRQMLVEDHTSEGSASYVDFLCHLHKEIRTLLT